MIDTYFFQVHLTAIETNAHLLPRLVQQTLFSTQVSYTHLI